MRARIALIAMLASILVAVGVSAQGDAPATFTGELTRAQPSAAFEVDLEAGQIVTLSTALTENLDTILTLNDAAGNEVAQNDDEGGGVLTSRIVYVVERSGTYSVVVTGYGGATGAFTLEVIFGADFGLSAQAVTLLEETVSLTTASNEVKFKVELAAGDILVATTQALTPNLDTTLRLLDAGGTILAENDDRGDGSLNSQIVYEVAVAGEYVVVISTYGGTGSGDALLSIATDPNAEAPFNFASIEGTLIEQFTGALDDARTSQDFTLGLEAGQTILLLSDATSGNLDTVLTLFDPEGFLVATNDDRGDGTLNSAVAYTVPASGTYQVTVERFPRSTSSGGFRLTVQIVDASVVDTLNALAENAVVLSGEVQIIQTTNFLVHYTLEGVDATTPDYAQEVADTLEEIYDVQVNQIGWAEPVRSSDGLYHAYIADSIGQGGGALGYAKSVLVVVDNPNTTAREQRASRAVFVIDNDFADLDKDASVQSLMRATVTHEFNHIIQYGYDSLEGLDWMYESTASWTETVTVGNDQDATDYVTNEYKYPELCFTTGEQDGYLDYGQWTLLQSLADVYGERIVISLWENAVPYDGFEVMERTLDAVGTTIPDAIVRWRIQNFARAYDLAPLFGSTVWVEETIDDAGEWSFTGAGIQELAANYFALELDGAHQFTLDGARTLELWALGVRGGEVFAIPLGREGVFDASAYEYAALMVFNRVLPNEPGACAYIDYSIRVQAGSGTTPDALYSFSAENFAPLSNN